MSDVLIDWLQAEKEFIKGRTIEVHLRGKRFVGQVVLGMCFFKTKRVRIKISNITVYKTGTDTCIASMEVCFLRLDTRESKIFRSHNETECYITLPHAQYATLRTR